MIDKIVNTQSVPSLRATTLTEFILSEAEPESHSVKHRDYFAWVKQEEKLTMTTFWECSITQLTEYLHKI